MPSRYFVRGAEVPGYHPANHTGTTNRRLVHARHVEVVHGTIERGHGALPHAHPGIEQVCYMLEGTAVAEVGGERCELGPGDACYFPPDEMHVFTVTSATPAKVLVIYTPPYGEDPKNVVRGAGAQPALGARRVEDAGRRPQ